MSDDLKSEVVLNGLDLWNAEKDICYLYHLLAEYPGIDGDHAYGTLFALPYWDILRSPVINMQIDGGDFIRNGCLVFLLAMAWDVIDGSGKFLVERLSICRQAVGECICNNEETKRLIDIVNLAFDTVEVAGKASQELVDGSVWVNRTFVLRYFESMVDLSASGHLRASVRR